MWTHFWDMHSGGGLKEKWSHIYIEAPIHEAKLIFYNRFGHNPERVTCTCCGEDYSISENKSLQQLTGYHRGCDYKYFDKNGDEIPSNIGWQIGKGIKNGCIAKYVEEVRKDRCSKYIPFKKYLQSKEVKVIRAKDIKAKERIGELPEQGYVWVE